MGMGRDTDKGDEFPPPHRACPQGQDHGLIITPRIAARSGHFCPLRVILDQGVRSHASMHVCFAPKAAVRSSSCDPSLLPEPDSATLLSRVRPPYRDAPSWIGCYAS